MLTEGTGGHNVDVTSPLSIVVGVGAGRGTWRLGGQGESMGRFKGEGSDPNHSVGLYLLSGAAPQHKDGKKTPPAAMFVPLFPTANTTAPWIAAV